MNRPRVKICYIISKIDFPALEFLWVSEYIDKSKFKLEFILLNNANSALEDALNSYCGVYCIQYSNRKKSLSTLIRLLRLLRKLKPDAIHTHMLDATLLGLLAGKIVGVKHRIYTRHHSSLNYEYYPSKVIYDKISNYLSTQIISISSTVSTILKEWEKVNEGKITEIPHGLDLSSFKEVAKDEIAQLKTKYNPANAYPVVGVVSRYTHWKGVQYIIQAFKELLKTETGALLVLANARKGEYVDEIVAMLDEIPSKNFIEISFESNNKALFQLFDVFVHVPINIHVEAFGQIYIEALTAGIPCVFTKSGIASDIPNLDFVAEIVDYCDSNAILEAVTRSLRKQKTKEWTQQMQQSVEGFSIENKIASLEDLYEKAI